MRTYIYTGKIKHLYGKSAFGTLLGEDKILVQFDDMSLTMSGKVEIPQDDSYDPKQDYLGYGWHEFPVSDFGYWPE